MNKEIFKDIKDYEGLYQVSNLGRVKSLSRIVRVGNNYYLKPEKMLKEHINCDGYKSVVLYKNNNKKRILLHQLVALTFIPNNNNFPIVNHKDFNKGNNKVENLEWCSPKYNVRYSNGIKIKQLNKNRELIKIWCCLSEASQKLNINVGNIGACLKNKRKSAGGYLWEYEVAR